MKIANQACLDALCGEYLLGTLRGLARRRFERALQKEPLAALRLNYWRGIFTPRYAQMVETQPSTRSWKRLEAELELNRYRTPWYRRAMFWQGWAAAATAALVLAVSIQAPKQLPQEPTPLEIAQLADKAGPQVAAALSRDGRTLELRSARPVLAGPAQSYELWLIPAEGGDAISLAVLGSLDARFAVPSAQVGRLRAGAKLAVSVEPAGGSPTGKATGPVILIGQITI
jgi:anti-sigma-K factor RskA